MPGGRWPPEPDVPARTADLVARESLCCSFLDFTLRVAQGSLTLDVAVPGAQITVLDGRWTGPVADDRPMTGGLRSGQVAEAAGVSVQTLRYYGRRGLIEAPDRTLGGHRLYPAATVTLLRAIKAAQRLGFSLNEVADLLETAAGRRRTPGARKLPDRIRVKIDELDRQIDELSSVR